MEVTLFFNCSKYSSVFAPRVPRELIFDPASTLFIGQAGGIIGGQFEVSPAACTALRGRIDSAGGFI